MPDKAYFDAKLNDIRRLIGAGDFASARLGLEALGQEADRNEMGELTALNLPRRLHSAYLRLAKAEGDGLAKVGYQYLLVPPPQTLSSYGQFSPNEIVSLAAKNREAVPRLLHQVWIGDKPLPPSTTAWAHHADRHGYQYRLWREDDLARAGFSRDPVFQAMLSQGDYPGAVDVARYLILSSVGGLYLDCDFYPARDDISFHDCLPLVGLTAFAEDVPRLTGYGSVLLANSFIAAPAGHPVFARILQALPDIAWRLPRAPAWWATGPLIFTIVARAGAVSLAPAGLIAGSLSDRAPFAAVEEIRQNAKGAGLLIAWKSW